MPGPSKPVGPHPALLVGLGAGVSLCIFGYANPTIHLIWQIPLGLYLVIAAIGKMSAR